MCMNLGQKEYSSQWVHPKLVAFLPISFPNKFYLKVLEVFLTLCDLFIEILQDAEQLKFYEVHGTNLKIDILV